MIMTIDSCVSVLLLFIVKRQKVFERSLLIYGINGTKKKSRENVGVRKFIYKSSEFLKISREIADG